MNYQDYQIVLSSDLGLTPEEFAAEWNASPEYHDISEAKLIQEKGATFEPITLTVILLTVGTGAAANLVSDLVKSLVQKAHDKKRQQTSQQQSLPPAHFHKRIVVEETRKPDGTFSLMIDSDEEKS